MTGAPAFTADDVRAVTGDVWEACLARYGALVDAVTRGPLDGEVAQAQVRIAGDWNGVVSLEMSEETAVEAARVLLEVDQVTREEVADAVGELVNIIGGNLKSLLPTPSRLSLPRVTRTTGGAPAGVAVGDAPVSEHCRADLTWGARPVLVRVWS